MIDVVMPQMGESIVEGTLTKWLKKPGEHVERDEPLFEISTDKVDTEIPSPAAGTLAEVLVEEGKTVAINAVVGRIQDGASGSRSAPAPAPAAAATPAPAPAPAPVAAAPAPAPRRPGAPSASRSSRRGGQFPRLRPKMTAGPLSPLVRKMARENNIDLSKIRRHRRRQPHHQARSGGISDASARSSRAGPSRRAGSRSSPAAAARASARAAASGRRHRAAPVEVPAAASSRLASRRASLLPCPAQPPPTRRAHEQHAAEDRRAHGVQQAHLRARHHRAQGRHDQESPSCATS